MVKAAHAKGVRLLALTDHDTVSGLGEARAEAEAHGMTLVPGIEINTSEPDQIHILGYRIDPASPALLAKLAEYREHRRQRVALMLAKCRELGLEIGAEDLGAVSRESVGRPHIADALRKKGYVRTRQEAFAKYLMRGKPAYVEPVGPGIREAIETINAAGGVAVLAHPGFVQRGLELAKWVQSGLRGLEVYYPSHSASYTRRLIEEARPFGLLLTGGSDYHGPGTGRDVMAAIDPPEEAWGPVAKALCEP